VPSKPKAPEKLLGVDLLLGGGRDDLQRPVRGFPGVGIPLDGSLQLPADQLSAQTLAAVVGMHSAGHDNATRIAVPRSWHQPASRQDVTAPVHGHPREPGIRAEARKLVPPAVQSASNAVVMRLNRDHQVRYPRQ
jgi:hypothetical protein